MTNEHSLVIKREAAMTPQNRPIPISSFQYWMYQLKHLPNSVLLALNVFFVLVIVLFSTKQPSIPEEWYPGGIRKPQPTTHIVIPTLGPLPTIPEPPPLPPAPPAAPVSQPEPIVGVFVPEQPVAVVEEPIPTIEVQPTVLPTPDKQATVDAWLLASPSTPTSSPASSEPGFAESFQPEPECNLFIGYVGKKREHCNAVYAMQTEEAQP